MPSDVIAIAVSTGIGVSVFAGVVSGVCYILVHGFARKRTCESSLQWYCVVCGTYLRLRGKEKIKAIICAECEERACKNQCSKKNYIKKQWICYKCLKRPSWLQSVLNNVWLSYKKVSCPNKSIESGKMGKKMEGSALKSEDEKECVRDFMEKLVFTIVGGSVDDASVFRLYNDSQYQDFFGKHHQDLSEAITTLSSALQLSIKNSSCIEQNPSEAHTTLKSLIETIIQEAARLPGFKKPIKNSLTSDDGNERTYEELLATAILNKIISKEEHSRLQSLADHVSRKKNTKARLKHESRSAEWNDLESTSSSSIDEYLLSDSSHGSIKYIDRVSLTIQQRFEDADVYEDVDNSLQALSHESSYSLKSHHPKNRNWYLKKRQISGKNSPISVPMLVPNSLTSAKVLIGDKEVDETSDLSDGNSESGDISRNPKVQTFTIDSTLLIEKRHNYVSDEETSFDSGVREDKDDFIEHDRLTLEDPSTADIFEDHDIEEHSPDSVQSSIERDSEYTEQISSLSKAQYRDLSRENELSSLISEQNKDRSFQHSDPENLYQSRMKKDNIFIGSYSRREKDKWNHPVNMLNNPYSEENIRRRIQSNQRFGRDYYTKQASLPSGKLKSDEAGTPFWTVEEDVYKAVPATTTDSESEFQSNEIYTHSQWNLHEQNESDTIENQHSYSSDTTENLELSYEPHGTDKNVVKIKVNEKQTNELDIKVNEKHTFIYEPESVVEKSVADGTNSVKNIERPNSDTDKPNDNSQSRKEAVENITPKVTSTEKIHNKTAVRNNTSISTVDPSPLKESLIKNDAPKIVAKKSDNTLIRKIYSNPVVRNFALSNREQIPYVDIDKAVKSDLKTEPKNVEILFKDNKDSDDDKTDKIVQNASEKEFRNIELLIKDDRDTELSTDDNSSFPDNKKDDEENVPKYNFSLEFSESDSLKKQSSVQNENEYNELKEKRLVSNLLNEYSKSFPNLTKISSLHYDNNKTSVYSDTIKEHSEDVQKEDVEPHEIFVSVKDLKKLFENKHDMNYSKDKPVHSLTARSISKEMKEKLKTYSDTRIDVQYRKDEDYTSSLISRRGVSDKMPKMKFLQF